MHLPRWRFTVRRMMVSVAVVGVALAGFRHGYGVIVALVYGVTGLALARAIGLADRDRARGFPAGKPRMRRHFFASLAAVTVFLLLSALPMVGIYPAFAATVRSDGQVLYDEQLRDMAIVGGLACLPVAWLLRKTLWS